MDAIVYTSNTGFTEQYAKLLSKLINLPAYTIAEAKTKLSQNAEIIYIGWLMAGNIKGYKKAIKHFSIKAVAGVGMAPMSDNKQLDDIINKHGLNKDSSFYLQGGYDGSKLHGIYKLMMKTMEKIVGKSLEKKADRTAEEESMLNILKHGGNFVTEDNLKGIIDWYNKQ